MLANMVAEARGQDVRRTRQDRVYFGQLRSGSKKVGIVRHPVRRFISLYKNIQQRARSPENFYAKFEGRPPAELLAGIKEVGYWYDIHFQPQISVGIDDPSVELVPLYRWSEYCAREGLTPSDSRNASGDQTVELSAATISELEKLYADDLALWYKADKDFRG